MHVEAVCEEGPYLQPSQRLHALTFGMLDGRGRGMASATPRNATRMCVLRVWSVGRGVLPNAVKSHSDSNRHVAQSRPWLSCRSVQRPGSLRRPAPVGPGGTGSGSGSLGQGCSPRSRAGGWDRRWRPTRRRASARLRLCSGAGSGLPSAWLAGRLGGWMGYALLASVQARSDCLLPGAASISKPLGLARIASHLTSATSLHREPAAFRSLFVASTLLLVAFTPVVVVDTIHRCAADLAEKEPAPSLARDHRRRQATGDSTLFDATVPLDHSHPSIRTSTRTRPPIHHYHLATPLLLDTLAIVHSRIKEARQYSSRKDGSQGVGGDTTTTRRLHLLFCLLSLQQHVCALQAQHHHYPHRE